MLILCRSRVKVAELAPPVAGKAGTASVVDVPFAALPAHLDQHLCRLGRNEAPVVEALFNISGEGRRAPTALA